MLERIGTEPVTGCELWLLEVAGPGDLPLELDSPPAALSCLLAWDAIGVAVDDIDSVARRLLGWGAGYICCWGPGCERVHDIIDDVAVMAQLANPAAPEELMTTWHQDEPLEEALEFLLACANPQPCPPGAPIVRLAISVGAPAWASAAREWLDRAGAPPNSNGPGGAAV